jgi:predicted O-linked N-acetylglucosamine transferase (SPINDLY family)
MITLETFKEDFQTFKEAYTDERANELISFLNTLNILQLELIIDDAIYVYYTVAHHLINTQQPNENISMYVRKILELDPYHKNAFEILKLNTINLCSKNTDLKEMLVQFKNLLVYNPFDYQLQYLIGMTCHKINDYDGTFHHLKLAIGIADTKMNYTDDLHTCITCKVNSLYTIAQIYYDVNNMYLCRYYALQAYNINPNDEDVNNLLGVIYMNMRIIDKALEHFGKIPDEVKTPAVYINMGTAYAFYLDYKRAIECYDKLPDSLPAYQNKLFTSHYILHTIKDEMYMYILHKGINHFFANTTTDAKKGLPNYVMKRNTQKLKIGFVGSEYIHNNIRGAIMYFIHSIFELIDFNKFDLICYSTKHITQLQSLFPKILCKYIHNGITTDELKQIIQSDEIDILFDLSGHTAVDRLDVFAYRAAPIQISYCAYPNTTGIANMDYHIVDRYCDSDGITPGPGGIIRPSTQKYYTEKLLFMDNCFLTYTPYVDSIPVIDVEPCQKNGYLSIGTFNKINKINENVIAVWETILERCPNVRLIMKSKDFSTPVVKKQFMSMWKNKSLHKRVSILDFSITNTLHLLEYNNLDLALDTFPYSGTCTTCDALYMGVPVVTLFDCKRQYHVQNVSTSILINAGLSEYVCFSEEEYIDKVVYYANHLEELHNIKNNIRTKFVNTVCNNEKFVREFEAKMQEVYTDLKM